MSLDTFQQVFFLSLMSNAMYNQTGTQANLQGALTALINRALSHVGDWRVVYGPVVWKKDPEDAHTGPNNSWLVAFNPSFTFEDGSVHPTYVVATAGKARTYSLTDPNFAVNSVVDFNQWVTGGISRRPVPVYSRDVIPHGTYVSMATIERVYNLLTFPGPQGTSLFQLFGNTEGVGKARVVFTGHSIGGVLAPTLALALVRSGTLQAAQGPGAGVLVYPTGGASPGNRQFANLFAATFPARRCPGSESGGYQVWNLNIANTLDVSVHVWCILPSESPAQNMDNIPPIYGKPVLSKVRDVVSLLKAHAASSRTIYIPLQSHLVYGTLPEVPPATDEEFKREAEIQHLPFYIGLLRIQLPQPNESGLQDARAQHLAFYANLLETHLPQSKGSVWQEYGLVEKTEKERFLDYSVIGDVQWAAEHPEETQSAVDVILANNSGVAALVIKE